MFRNEYNNEELPRCVERRDTELLSPLFQLVRRGEEEESEVERIQELFPHDDLRLHERDPVTQVSRLSSGTRRYSRQVV